MTAEEAEKLTVEYNHIYLESIEEARKRNEEEIYQMIKDACEKGMDYVTWQWGIGIHWDLVKKLETDGFFVAHSGQSSSIKTIAWGKEGKRRLERMKEIEKQELAAEKDLLTYAENTLRQLKKKWYQIF